MGGVANRGPLFCGAAIRAADASHDRDKLADILAIGILYDVRKRLISTTIYLGRQVNVNSPILTSSRGLQTQMRRSQAWSGGRSLFPMAQMLDSGFHLRHRPIFEEPLR